MISGVVTPIFLFKYAILAAPLVAKHAATIDKIALSLGEVISVRLL